MSRRNTQSSPDGQMSSEEKLAKIKKCFYNGQSRFVIHDEWRGDDAFVDLFNDWIRHVAWTVEKTYDKPNQETSITIIEPALRGPVEFVPALEPLGLVPPGAGE